MHIPETEVRQLLEIAATLGEAGGTHPALQADLVRAVTRLFRADFLAASLWDEAAGRYEAALAAGRDPSSLDSYHQYQSQDPFRRFIRMRAGSATCLHRVIRAEELRRSGYYQNHLHRFDLEDGVEIALLDHSGIVGDIRVWRGQGNSAMGSREEALMNLLAPSFLRALQQFKSTSRHDTSPELPADPHSATTFSAREHQVLEQLVKGLGDKEIAQVLNISFWTVRTHVAAIFRKLSASNRTEAAMLANKLGYTAIRV